VPRLEPARRPADAPTAWTGGLGNPGPTVRSRDCPSLLLARRSRRFSRFVVAGTARVAGVLLGKRSGTGPVAVRGGSQNALCLQGVSAAFRIRRSLGCWCGVLTRSGHFSGGGRSTVPKGRNTGQSRPRIDTRLSSFILAGVSKLAPQYVVGRRVNPGLFTRAAPITSGRPPKPNSYPLSIL
jgi:hypothetical protein